MLTETLHAIIRSFSVASKDATRPHLCCIKITLDPNEPKGILITATDGRMLSRLRMFDEEFRAAMPGPLLIPLETLPGLKLLAKEFKGSVVLPCAAMPDGVLLGATTQVGIKCEKVSGLNYPDLEPMLNPKYSAPIKISFDADLLRTLAHALGQHPKEKTIITLTVNADNLTAMTVEALGQSGLLMPCRLQKEATNG